VASSMITLNAKQIREVTPEGIRYVNEQGLEQFIDFAKCYQNFVKKWTSPEFWEQHKQVNNLTDADWDRHVERVMKWKEIGRSQPLEPPWSDGPFVAFHTEPPIHFKFETLDEYMNLMSGILKTGWKTFDHG
jgi:hypothetical protein